MAPLATGASVPLWLARGSSTPAKAAERQPAAKRPRGQPAAEGQEPEAKSRRRGKAPDAAACAALPAPPTSEEKAQEPPTAAKAKAKPRARGKAKAAPELPTPVEPAAPKEPAAPEEPSEPKGRGGKGKGKGKGGPPSTVGGHNAPGEDVRERVRKLPKVSPAEKISFTSMCMGLRLHFEEGLERRHKKSSVDSYVLTFQLLFKRDGRSFATMASQEYWNLIKVSTSNKKHHGIESAAITHFANFYAARAEQCGGDFKVDPKWGALLYNPGARTLPLVMKTRPSPPSALAKKGPKLGQSGDDEMMALTQRVPIVDPISLCRIEVPVRGRNCEHLQVFDRQPYIEFNQMMESKGKSKLSKIWNCPICQTPIQEKDLVVDENLAKILVDAKAFPGLTYVECLPCGTLALPKDAADMADEQDEESEEEDPGPVQDVTRPSNQGTASIMSFFAKPSKESSEAPGSAPPPTSAAPSDKATSPQTPPKAPEAQAASPGGRATPASTPKAPAAATPSPVKLAASAKGASSPAHKATQPAAASEPAPVVAEASVAPADLRNAMPLKVGRDAASALDAFAFVEEKPGEAPQKAAVPSPPQPVAARGREEPTPAEPTSDPEQQAKKRSREETCISPAPGGNLLQCFSRERPSPKGQKQPSPVQRGTGKASPGGSEAALPAWDEKAAVAGVSADLQSSFQEKLDALQSLACSKPRFS